VPPEKDEKTYIKRNKFLKRYYPNQEVKTDVNGVFVKFLTAMAEFSNHDSIHNGGKKN